MKPAHERDELANWLLGLDEVESVGTVEMFGEQWLEVQLSESRIPPTLAAGVGRAERGMVPQGGNKLLVEAVEGYMLAMPAEVFGIVGEVVEDIDDLLERDRDDPDLLRVVVNVIEREDDVNSVEEAREWLEDTREAFRIVRDGDRMPGPWGEV